MNKFLKKRLFKGLVLLTPVLVLGVPKAHADGIPIISDIFGAIGGFLSEIGADIAEGIGNLLSMVIQAIGGILYYVANTGVRFAIEMNLLLPESFIVRDGFSVVLTVANTALVAGVIVIAFAIMTRADWLSEARTAIPKFITAALLINFSLFIGLNLIIGPVDAITKRIYNATGFNEGSFLNSFRGPFNVNLDLKRVLATQLALSRAPDQPTADLIEEYFRLREQLLSDIYDLLVSTEENNFVTYPLDISLVAFQLEYYPRVTKSQREGTATAISELVDWYVERRLEANSSFFLSVTSDPTWNDLQETIKKALGASGAPYNVPGVYTPGHNPGELLSSVMDLIRNTYRNSPSFGCDLVNIDNDTGCQENLLNAAFYEHQGPSGTERIIIVLVEVLFEGAFVFLGSFSLLGLASMLFIRYVALSLLLILFPLVWIGWIFPKIAAAGGGKNIWNAWWNQFMRWVLFAPFAMFFLFLAVRASLLLERITPSTAEMYGSMSTISILASSVGNLLTILGLLIGGMYVANKMGIAGSKLFYGTMMKMRDRAGHLVKGLAARAGLAGLRMAGRGASAPLRSKWGRKAASALQGVGAGLDSGFFRDRLLKRALKPVTGTGSLMNRAIDKSGAAIINRLEKKWVGKDGKLKYAPFRFWEMYNGITSEPEKMAALRAAMKAGALWEAPESALRDIADWGANGNASFEKFNQRKMWVDLLEMGLSTKYIHALVRGIEHEKGKYRKATELELLNILREEYESAPDKTFLGFDRRLVGEKARFGFTGEGQDITSRLISRVVSEDRPNVAHPLLRKFDASGQAIFTNVMGRFRTGEGGFSDRLFEGLGEERRRHLSSPKYTDELVRHIETHEDAIRERYVRLGVEEAMPLSVPRETLETLTSDITAANPGLGRGEINAMVRDEVRRMNPPGLAYEQARLSEKFLNADSPKYVTREQLVKLVKEVMSAKHGGFLGFMGDAGPFPPATT